MTKSMSETRLKRTLSSALWSAYGDALGFPTELASEELVKKRVGQSRSIRTSQWKRLVGGKFGAEVTLPVGCYSDDTQLRLSTSRAISGQGYFDVEAFAKIEMPVWQIYALGAGRGSKAAASSLGNRSTNWFSNFFKGYESGGGNGAAMRIQPHVWAASKLDDKPSYLVDVIRNAICTHGHMRGIAGAVVHALSLAHVLLHGRMALDSEWLRYSDDIRSIPSLIRSDNDLLTFWVPAWEKNSKTSLELAAEEVANEWSLAVRKAMDRFAETNESPATLYAKIVEENNGLSKEERGSGVKSALFANVAALLGQRAGSQEIMEIVVNLLWSDTDTIASMAGALIGAAKPDVKFIGEIQDEPYIRMEANRLFNISQGVSEDTFSYPDTLYWQAPRAAIDTLKVIDGHYVVQGFGDVSPLGQRFAGRQKGAVWQWFATGWGQRLLIRMRAELEVGSEVVHKAAEREKNIADLFDYQFDDSLVDAEQSVLDSDLKFIAEVAPPPSIVKQSYAESKQALAVDVSSEGDNTPNKPITIDIDAMSSEAIKSFDPELIGQHLLLLAEQPNGVTLATGYASIVAKARATRLRHKR
ncbi:ADP-ribosylglycohydrolase family protein [Pseudomonas promysalinigenes]|uniref:ADP-ribosylglycohydrolase family protein n=1 Tax=Pseudomonas promysalinigenes TaxID=485898 RepID=A0ABY6AKJ6_9PSED|nr:ADP-ribosylglycohydrolase family protein [Pseudomonas promysalinigenes]UXH38816.1 ADP-ribosylglycohydrolase family protein [Pseudomonas promysalinigenes]